MPGVIVDVVSGYAVPAAEVDDELLHHHLVKLKESNFIEHVHIQIETTGQSGKCGLENYLAIFLNHLLDALHGEQIGAQLLAANHQILAILYPVLLRSDKFYHTFYECRIYVADHAFLLLLQGPEDSLQGCRRLDSRARSEVQFGALE